MFYISNKSKELIKFSKSKLDNFLNKLSAVLYKYYEREFWLLSKDDKSR